MTAGLVGAVVLAAGSGSRLGGPKLRMVVGGQSFLAHTVNVLAAAGVDPICCVVAAEDAPWARQEAMNAAVCVNPDPARACSPLWPPVSRVFREKPARLSHRSTIPMFALQR